MMAINYGRNHFDRVIIVRPHNVYGPDINTSSRPPCA
jgi:nucleoside-diphosphate-sugar epimerase